MIYFKEFATEAEYNNYIDKTKNDKIYLPNTSFIDSVSEVRFNGSKWNQLVNCKDETLIDTFTYFNQPFTFPKGDKVFLACDCKVTTNFTATASPQIYLSQSGSMWGGYISMIAIPKDNQWHHYEAVVESNDDRDFSICLYMYKKTAGSCWFKNVQAIYLTPIYGKGNEPTLQQFRTDYPDDYYPYHPLSI